MFERQNREERGKDKSGIGPMISGQEVDEN